MSAEHITAALLHAAPIVAIVDDRVALVELPQDVGYPAIVYNIVSDVPQPALCEPSASYIARVQVNPHAATVAGVLALHALIHQAMASYARRIVAGHALNSCAFSGRGPWSKDDVTGMFTRAADFRLLYTIQ